jgi:hypothetical protein
MVKKAWLISVNMGYGHQRTAFALRDLAQGGEIINANDYKGIPQKDRQKWKNTQRGYEAISSFKRIPFLGNFVFSIMDYFQRILGFYPKRDLSKPNIQIRQIISMIKRGWGKDLIESLKSQNLKIKKCPPIISTFFTPAFMAEYFEYPGEIFCVICDADISRTWAPLHPQKSKIKYFASTERVAERLKLYGVKAKNIFLTGYPLPLDMADDAKKNLKFRIANLDPQKKYSQKYKKIIFEKLGRMPQKSNHPLTLVFAVGGAGAQKEIAAKVMEKLAGAIKKKEIKLVLVSGIREKVKNYFFDRVKKAGLKNLLGDGLEILFSPTIHQYFGDFNAALRKTDILWTKPSELSFYAALGIPIIVAPTIGSQEEFNKRWIIKSGFGMAQENPTYVSDWFFDWIKNGYLAEAAMQGFIEGEKFGTYKIKKIILK